ncbi:MAG: radical SAM protein [Muribaculaceae bacterium]|nr:radical SAM protein [Muribaculaceae bacterium]
MKVDFKGKQIDIKEFNCRLGSIEPMRIAPSINLFVKTTKRCNAHCLFCSNADAGVPSAPFDSEKLVKIIDDLSMEGIRVNKINITGGEPSVAMPIVEEIITIMEEPRFERIHLHLNTNGLLPQSQELMRRKRWDSISVSLHHYSKARLEELYATPISSDALRFEGIDLQKINASCNLVKGYIDSAVEAHKMLDFAIERGILRIGFVALMKVNDYCISHFVDLEDIHIAEIPHVYFTQSMNRGTDCRCSNYLYNKDLKILEIYMRNYANPQYCESSLVYDGEYLRQGFHENNIIC